MNGMKGVLLGSKEVAVGEESEGMTQVKGVLLVCRAVAGGEGCEE